MKIAIVTDAWRPQTNGVVTTLARTVASLEGFGHEVVLMTPQGLPTIACPTYPEIRLALFQGRRVREWLGDERPDALHVATEGPLGFAARAAARRLGISFKTSYHTQFPRYLRARYPIPESLSYAGLRFFHGAAARTMVATKQVRCDLRRRGLRNLVLWTRGVDTDVFRPRPDEVVRELADRVRPVLMYVGRVAIEKSVEDLLAVRTPGTKVVVGDGPALSELRARYPDALFLGFRFGEELARIVAAANAFVFPSRTDTFGIVMLEAMACGVPIAAYPTKGPIDVVRDGEVGCLDDNLTRAIEGALKIDRGRCREYALGFRWERATLRFLGNLVSAVPARAGRAVRAVEPVALAAQPRGEPAPRLNELAHGGVMRAPPIDTATISAVSNRSSSIALAAASYPTWSSSASLSSYSDSLQCPCRRGFKVLPGGTSSPDCWAQSRSARRSASCRPGWSPYPTGRRRTFDQWGLWP